MRKDKKEKGEVIRSRTTHTETPNVSFSSLHRTHSTKSNQQTSCAFVFLNKLPSNLPPPQTSSLAEIFRGPRTSRALRFKEKGKHHFLFPSQFHSSPLVLWKIRCALRTLCKKALAPTNCSLVYFVWKKGVVMVSISQSEWTTHENKEESNSACGRMARLVLGW